MYYAHKIESTNKTGASGPKKRPKMNEKNQGREMVKRISRSLSKLPSSVGIINRRLWFIESKDCKRNLILNYLRIIDD